MNPSHGTRSSYRHGCRCLLCRAANARYAAHAWNKRKLGTNDKRVTSNLARLHLQRLAAAGVGYRTVAERSGVAVRTVQLVRAGRKPRVLLSTLRRLMAVRSAVVRWRGRDLVDAAPVWAMCEELLAEGFTKVSLARRLGVAVPLQLGRRRVTVQSAAKVETLYRRLMTI